MLISDGRITLSAAEFSEFKALTFAPWVPRSIAEFNAMCDLGAARHFEENTDGVGWMRAWSCSEAKFDKDGNARFPVNPSEMAYIKQYGTVPTADELKAFEATAVGSAPNNVVTADFGSARAGVKPVADTD